LLVSVLHSGKLEYHVDCIGLGPKINGDVVLPAVFESAPRLFSRLEPHFVKACFLTMHARGRWDSHRQNELVLALDFIRFGDESKPTHRR
jgi:hypothetical protein